MRRKLTHEEVRRLFAYDANTGSITNRITRNSNAKVGAVAGFISKGKHAGYRVVKVYSVNYSVGQIIWVYMTGRWPKHEIDHKNLVRDDDRWDNLRESTRSQNCANKGQFFKKNAYGFRGVKRQPSGRFRAVVCCNQIEYSLGTYDTPVEAARAYDVGALKHHGEYARLNFP